MLRRHFTLGGICTAVAGLFHASAFAQRQVISSNGAGLEGEVTTTRPRTPRGQSAMNQVPPPGSAPAPGSVPVAAILVLGDSLSAEYGIQRGRGWVALMAAQLQKERGDVQVVNASISGDTTAGGRSRLPALLNQVRPVMVVIELGANDALRGLDLDSTNNNFEAMIEACRSVNAKVVLVGMQIPPNYGPDYGAKFAVMFANLSKKYKTGLVPFLLKGIADVPDAINNFQNDRIHPREEAHPKMLANVLPEVKKQLNQ